MTYATDGRCHNAQPGHFNHECGRPAAWIGTQPNGFRSGFCHRCKQTGAEARTCVSWEPIHRQTVLPGAEPLTSAQVAQRRASQPLRPKKEQKPCDVGLFSDERDQTDLVDLSRR